MRLTRSLLACLLLLVLASAFAATSENPKSLSSEEASAIAHEFYEQKIRVEGSVTEPHLDGDFWVFPLKVGVAGSIARDPIRVNRFTGEASWAGLEPARP